MGKSKGFRIQRNLKFFWYAIWNRGDYGLLMTGQTFGKFRVDYGNDQYSVPMYYNNAKAYAEIYGGKVILKEEME